MNRTSSPRSAATRARCWSPAAVLLVGSLAACSAKSTPPPGVTPIHDGGAASGTGGTGGSGGDADPASTSTGTGPSPAWTCSGDAAYRATATAFTSPTTAALASALDELVYPYEARPITIVIHEANYARTGAASATVDQGEASVFAAPAPDLIALEETAEGFGNLTPQARGELALVDAQGPLTIALEEIRWRARPDDGCGSIWVSFDAVIPASEGEKELHLAGGTASIAALAGSTGAPDGGLAGYPVHAWFLGESTVFDFNSLPASP